MENKDQPPAKSRRPTRKRSLIALSALFSAIAIGYGAHWYLDGRFHIETDNAYVQGNVVQITPQIAGTVMAINVDDTDYVAAGQTLVRLDPADAQVALEQAEAQLAQTVREVRTTYANNGALAANITLRQAEVARAQAEVVRAEDDLARRRPLVATGAVGKEELHHVETALANAQAAHAAAVAALAAAREQLASNQSLTEGTTVENHPNVQRAAARVRETFLAFKRADIVAPVSGHVAKRNVQVGQRVQAGAPMMAIIPLNQIWVDANFKETQLRDMRIGQSVRLVADMYGEKVEYKGTIQGLGAGTGAAFSLLPAQNATGNWIKIVQRVPVRVALDPNQVTAHPLRVGLSMTATVDIRDQSGKTLADGTRAPNVAQASGVSGLEAAADATVNRIVSANLGHGSETSHKPAKAAVGKAPSIAIAG